MKYLKHQNRKAAKRITFLGTCCTLLVWGAAWELGSTLPHRTQGNRLQQRESRPQGKAETSQESVGFVCLCVERGTEIIDNIGNRWKSPSNAAASSHSFFLSPRYTAAQQQGSDILEATTHHIKVTRLHDS